MESVLGSVGTKRALSPTSQSEGGRAKRTRWKTKRLRQAEEDQQQINEEEKEEEPEPFLVPRRPPAQGTTFLGPRNQVAFAPCSELNDNHIQVDIEMQMEQIHQGTETSEDFARFEKTRQNNDWHPSQKERVPGINFALEAKTIPTEKGSLKVMKGPELNIGHFQKEGFSHPLLVPNPAGLGLSAPGGSSSSSNMIRGIRRMVGSRVTMEVLDQTTHKVSSMTMKYWKRYFLTEPRQREQSLSVPGLEFSGTPFGSKIKSPRLVRQLDWLDRAWPRYLRGLITPQDCPREDWLYPRVRKTLSMFSQGSWNEFKIAPGGSSTW